MAFFTRYEFLTRKENSATILHIKDNVRGDALRLDDLSDEDDYESDMWIHEETSRMYSRS